MKTRNITLSFLYNHFKAHIKTSKMFYVVDNYGNLTPLGEILFFYFVACSCSDFFYEDSFGKGLYKYFINDLNELLKGDGDI